MPTSSLMEQRMPTMTLWGDCPAVVAPDSLKPARRATWMKRCAACMSRASTARMKGSNLNTAGDSIGPAQDRVSVIMKLCISFCTWEDVRA